MAANSLTPLFQGLGLGAGLIIAIGAQNAYVLRQGLRRQYIFATALICTLCDMTLIALGVGGLGFVFAQSLFLTAIATWGGATFLFLYGLRSFRAAATANSLNAETGVKPTISLKGVIIAALGFSLLNPHVYLDTVVLVGSIGGRYPSNERVAFASGAMLASALWFFSLAYGAAWLAPLFQRPIAWRILDTAIGCVMWGIAASLIWHALGAYQA
ncbi:MAG: LysE/ArgO family amino acid transporter [Chloroflexi bacterium]|nr:LysE/ArgO family amino acid transporter [Chloroflexota bacterium]